MPPTGTTLASQPTNTSSRTHPRSPTMTRLLCSTHCSMTAGPSGAAVLADETIASPLPAVRVEQAGDLRTEHAALLGMPLTLCAVATGCLQMRHAELDGCREHNGTMVIASGNGARDDQLQSRRGLLDHVVAGRVRPHQGDRTVRPARPVQFRGRRPGRSPPSPRKPGISSSTISPLRALGRYDNTPIAGKPGLRVLS